MVVLSKTFFYKFILHVVVLQPQNYRNNLGLGPNQDYFGNFGVVGLQRVI